METCDHCNEYIEFRVPHRLDYIGARWIHVKTQDDRCALPPIPYYAHPRGVEAESEMNRGE